MSCTKVMTNVSQEPCPELFFMCDVTRTLTWCSVSSAHQQYNHVHPAESLVQILPDTVGTKKEEKASIQ